MESLNKELLRIATSTDNKLIKYVAEYVAEFYKSDEEIRNFFEDLRHGGCASGMVGDLIQHKQTSAFFLQFENEIEDLKDDLEEETGDAIKIEGRITDFFSWFGFEMTADNLAALLQIN